MEKNPNHFIFFIIYKFDKFRQYPRIINYKLLESSLNVDTNCYER